MCRTKFAENFRVFFNPGGGIVRATAHGDERDNWKE